jgi:phosphoribosylanthranilate isomerase
MLPSCGIKLCGLKTEADVRLAVELGVDAIGFVLTESVRRVAPAEARRLRMLVPPGIRVHGVFAADPPEYIREQIAFCGLDVAQVHGPEDDPDFWTALKGVALLRAFRVRGPETLLAIRNAHVSTFLLDAYVPGLPGGTGATFDWSLALRAKNCGRVILAGGLTPENVTDAIRAADPWMVDVSGGIELEKGVKDPEKMRAFVEAVRGPGSA